MLIILVLCCSCVLAEQNISNSSLNLNELTAGEYFACTQKFFDEAGQETYTNPNSYLLHEVTSFLGVGLAAQMRVMGQTPTVESMNAFCADRIVEKRYYKYINELTENISKQTGTLNDQIGLEDYYFEDEKNKILNNINGGWVYIHLLFDLFIELLMIMFYLVQFYLVIYLLLIALPKGFLYLRDGITTFMVKKKVKSR